ncbi:hypothetical protein ACTUVN_002374 [Pseudomonas caspiana]
MQTSAIKKKIKELFGSKKVVTGYRYYMGTPTRRQELAESTTRTYSILGTNDAPWAPGNVRVNGTAGGVISGVATVTWPSATVLCRLSCFMAMTFPKLLIRLTQSLLEMAQRRLRRSQDWWGSRGFFGGAGLECRGVFQSADF